ncbi:MAG: NADH:ubiquinone reductase (Na(+)-transporting) subunit B [Candidatus Hydrogenedentota bacterium]
MKFLKDLQDKQHEMLFAKGKPLEKLYPLFEAGDTFMLTPGETTKGASHVRDGLDLKRMMFTVVIALSPCMLMAMYNTGLQAFLAIEGGALPGDTWQTNLYQFMGWDFNTASWFGCILFGAIHYIPIYAVTMTVGGLLEALFAVIRKHDITEGFLVSGALFPLILPASTPLWQVAMGIAFGVVVAKEIFGGVGMNFLNPALAGRAFLFFAYPAQISGDKVWIAAQTTADGYSGATLLGRAALTGMDGIRESGFTWGQAFLGFIPGSIGETSTLLCLFGAAVLIISGVGSWRTMAGCVAGSFVMAVILTTVGSETNPMFEIPFYWHWVLGGFAFAAVFMATDPVSSAFTNNGKLIYGFFIGIFGILVRTINPAFPEGWMLAILFMNMVAPLIDYFFIQENIKRREARYAAE